MNVHGSARIEAESVDLDDEPCTAVSEMSQT
jgi:hypothetical protein